MDIRIPLYILSSFFAFEHHMGNTSKQSANACCIDARRVWWHEYGWLQTFSCKQVSIWIKFAFMIHGCNKGCVVVAFINNWPNIGLPCSISGINATFPNNFCFSARLCSGFSSMTIQRSRSEVSYGNMVMYSFTLSK